MIPEFIMCALTLWCEARGEPLAGKMLVASTFTNRAAIHQTSIRKQLLRPAQYSCWNSKAERRKILRQYNTGKMTGSEWEECKMVAQMIYDGTLPRTPFDHYYNPDKCSPTWKDDLTNKKKVGSHIFGSCK